MTDTAAALAPPIGYFDRWTARPGEALELKVSSPLAFSVAVARVLQGDERPGAPARRIEHEGWWPVRDFPPQVQECDPGSCVITDPVAGLRTAERYSVALRFSPTLLGQSEPQAVAALVAADGRGVLQLVLVGEGACELWLGAGLRRRGVRADGGLLQRGGWYGASFGVDLERRVARLEVRRLGRSPAGADLFAAEVALDAAEVAAFSGEGRPERLMLGAGGYTAASGAARRRFGHYSGKIEAPSLEGVGFAAAGGAPFSYAWRLGPELRGALVAERAGAEPRARLVNAPTPALTGSAYDGSVISFHDAPELFGALGFHGDDLEDAAWQTTATLRLPPGLASGVYAAELTNAAGSRYVPFFVAPRRDAPRPPIVVVLPTFTYQAYANEHVREGLEHFAETPQHPSRQDHEISAHRDFGLSLYDHHDDGSGVSFSSTRRPVLNLDPTYRFWLFDGPVHLGEDLYLLDWLERQGHAYDVVTDHLLHAEGRACLAGYRVVITGSHPEYVSGQMLDALEDHVQAGGRLMYLGGNGFYWVTSLDPARPHLIEVRRGNAGGRAWESAPGETHHATTGEPGGLWRHRGRPPNRLFGVGFAAQGADDAAPGYRRVNRDERFAFAFAGLKDEAAIGADGLLLGGAAGNEVDRADPARGTPAETVVLATSTGHSDAYQLAIEDLSFTAPGQGGTTQPLVRADMTLTPYVSGGGVFSVGAITYLGALALNNYDNDVARLTENVLVRFLSPAPL